MKICFYYSNDFIDLGTVPFGIVSNWEFRPILLVFAKSYKLFTLNANIRFEMHDELNVRIEVVFVTGKLFMFSSFQVKYETFLYTVVMIMSV